MVCLGGGNYDAPVALRQGAGHRRQPARQVGYGLGHHGPLADPW